MTSLNKNRTLWDYFIGERNLERNKLMRVMEYIREHREDENPFECVILPDGSVDAPEPSHIEKLDQIAGVD